MIKMVKTVTPSVLSVVINLIQYWIAFRLNILQRNFDKLKSWCRDLYSLKNTIEKKENKEFWKKILDYFICESHWLRCFRCRNSGFGRAGSTVIFKASALNKFYKSNTLLPIS